LQIDVTASNDTVQQDVWTYAAIFSSTSQTHMCRPTIGVFPLVGGN